MDFDFGACGNCRLKSFTGENSKFECTQNFNGLQVKSQSLLTVAFENALIFQNINTEEAGCIKLCVPCSQPLNDYCNSRKHFLKLSSPNSMISQLFIRNNCTSASEVLQIGAGRENPKTYCLKNETNLIINSNFEEETILPDQDNDNDQKFYSSGSPPNNLSVVDQETCVTEYKEQFIKLKIDKLSEEIVAQYSNQKVSLKEKSDAVSDISRFYRCFECSRIFSTLEQLEYHKSLIHTSTTNNFLCNFCPKTFSMAWFLKNHLYACHSGFEILHYCQICKKKFYNEKDLKDHVLKEHDMRKHPYNCKSCTESFINIRALRTHLIATHKGTKEAIAAEFNLDGMKQIKLKRTQCNFCEEIFGNFDILRRHLASDHAEENSKCDVCHKEFSFYKNMILHREVHTNCPTCDKSFLNYKKMSHHFYLFHYLPDDPSFECEMCGLKKSSYKLLDNHYQWHAGQWGPKFFCNICNKAFQLKPQLVQHIKASHSENPQKYKCRYCQQVCSSTSNLNNHMRLKHQSHLDFNFTCEICEKKFKVYSGLLTHQRIHKFENIKMEKRELTLTDGKVEIMSCYSSEKLGFTCPICGKQLNSPTHFYRHLKRAHCLQGYADPNIKLSSTINCTLCEKTFVRKDQLDKHKRAVHHLSKKKSSPADGVHVSYDCPHCGKTFRNSFQIFMFHVRRHEIYIVEDTINNPKGKKELSEFYNEEDKKFTCTICKRSFDKQSSFLTHVSTKSHSTKVIYDDGRKKILLPFKCEQCPGIEYPTGDLLRKHYQVSHTWRKSRIRTCNICHEKLRSQKYLKIHMKTVH